MKILGVIPSRMESKRLPGKPLLDINGKSMIQRVYESSINCKNLDDLIIATPWITQFLMYSTNSSGPWRTSRQTYGGRIQFISGNYNRHI